MKRLIVLATLVSLLAFPEAASAESRECTTSTGSYGQATTVCKTQGEAVTVKHEVKETGIGDFSFYTMAVVLLLTGAGFFGISKLAERIYWFD